MKTRDALWLLIGFSGAAVLAAHISRKSREENKPPKPPAPDEPKLVEGARVNVITFPKRVRE